MTAGRLSGRPPTPQVDGRVLLTFATSKYHSAWAELPTDKEVAELAVWLCDEQLGERRFPPAPVFKDPGGPTRTEIQQAIDTNVKAGDAVVVYVTGHGEDPKTSPFELILGETVPERPLARLTAIELLKWLRSTPASYVLAILDMCNAAAVSRHLGELERTPLPPLPSSWLILASAAADQKAVPLKFTGAVTAAIGKLREGGERHGVHQEYFKPREFIDALMMNMTLDQTVKLLRGRDGGDVPHPCLPNPHYRLPEQVIDSELGLLRRDLELHGTLLLTSRAKLFRDVLADVQQGPGVTVLTGRMGSGKSMILRRLTTLSDPDFRDQHAALLARTPADLLPDAELVTLAVDASRRDSYEVLESIAEAIDWALPRQDRALRLSECIADQQDMMTVVIDGIDDANSPSAVLADLITLVTGAGRAQLRLVLGLGAPAGPLDPASDGWGRTLLADLIDALLHAELTPTVLQADDDAYWDEQADRPDGDLYSCVLNILRRTPESAYPAEAQLGRAESLARDVALNCRRSYLLAQLAATSLATQEAVGDDDPRLLAVLRGGLVEVVRNDLPTSPDKRRDAVALLRAVAFARGKGVPWEGVWPAMANAIAGTTHQAQYWDRRIGELLQSPMSTYLRRDVEDDVTVYRLIHAELRALLRNSWQDLLMGPTP